MFCSSLESILDLLEGADLLVVCRAGWVVAVVDS
jgi:hypothetical protein